jgi:hypothetical protein
MFSLFGIALVTQSYRNACKEASDPKFSFSEDQACLIANPQTEIPEPEAPDAPD